MMGCIRGHGDAGLQCTHIYGALQMIRPSDVEKYHPTINKPEESFVKSTI